MTGSCSSQTVFRNGARTPSETAWKRLSGALHRSAHKPGAQASFRCKAHEKGARRREAAQPNQALGGDETIKLLGRGVQRMLGGLSRTLTLPQNERERRVSGGEQDQGITGASPRWQEASHSWEQGYLFEDRAMRTPTVLLVDPARLPLGRALQKITARVEQGAEVRRVRTQAGRAGEV